MNDEDDDDDQADDVRVHHIELSSGARVQGKSEEVNQQRGQKRFIIELRTERREGE